MYHSLFIQERQGVLFICASLQTMTSGKSFMKICGVFLWKERSYNLSYTYIYIYMYIYIYIYNNRNNSRGDFNFYSHF